MFEVGRRVWGVFNIQIGWGTVVSVTPFNINIQIGWGTVVSVTPFDINIKRDDYIYDDYVPLNTILGYKNV